MLELTAAQESENRGEEVDPELENLLKDNQRLVKGTLGAVNRLSKLATAVAESHEERIERPTRLAEHDGERLDRIERILESLAALVERFVRGHRGNGQAQ